MDNNQKTFDRNQYMPPKEQVDKPVQTASFDGGANDPTGMGKKSMKNYMILGGIIVVVVILALLAIARKPMNSSANGTNGTQSGVGMKVIPTLDPSKPSLAFSAAAGTHAVDEEFTVQLKADSKGADVNGYDLLLPYDKKSLEIVGVTSLSDAFQIYQFDRGSYYSITGIKLLSAKSTTAFTGQPILEFKLKGKKAGKYYLEIMSERGKESSKFVDKDVKIIKPQLQPIMVEIQ